MKAIFCDKFYFFIVLSLFFTITSHAISNDSIYIKGKLINNTKFSKVVVQKFGTAVYDIAAVAVDNETQEFVIVAPKNVESGIYRFKYSQTGFGDYVDVIINGKEDVIEFTVDVNEAVEKRVPFFLKSKENQNWYTFKKEAIFTEQKLNALHDFLMNYPDANDKTYATVFEIYTDFSNNLIKLYDNFIIETPYYWSKNLAAYNKPHLTSPKDHPSIQIFKKHEYFWEGKPTTDDKLLNSPLYTDAILNYVQYYMNPEMEFGEEEQKAGYKKCVDKIIQVFGDNEATKEFAIKYLQLGFKELANEKVLQYIDENYAVNEQCTADDAELKKRLEAYEKLKPGSQVPNISFIDTSGKNKTLKDYTHENIVLVFWASWCPHCMQEMPKLEEWAKQNPQSLVIAISLDDDFNSFQNAIKVFPSMLHYCDLQKWNGEIVSQFNVMATPTIFLLDKNKILLNKYSNINSLIKN